jgi:hypothetical protein
MRFVPIAHWIKPAFLTRGLTRGQNDDRRLLRLLAYRKNIEDCVRYRG